MQNVESMENQVLRQVNEGMHVVDAGGEDIGKVRFVKMGDPRAITTQGNDPEPGLVESVVNAVMAKETPEPEAPEPFRSQLQRSGYVKIDSPGFSDDRYATPDQIDRVSGEEVRLSVGQGDLIREG